VVSKQDELSSSFVWRSDVLGSVTKLATGRLVNGSSCDGIDMVIKDFNLEPKVDAISLGSFAVLPGGKN
ncbi:hypothetical protein Tco_0330282, partial [Tanacetum coccineum]